MKKIHVIFNKRYSNLRVNYFKKLKFNLSKEVALSMFLLTASMINITNTIYKATPADTIFGPDFWMSNFGFFYVTNKGKNNFFDQSMLL